MHRVGRCKSTKKRQRRCFAGRIQVLPNATIKMRPRRCQHHPCHKIEIVISCAPDVNAHRRFDASCHRPRSLPAARSVLEKNLLINPFPDFESPLSDGVVSLRRFTLDDVPEVTRACQDPEIVRWTASIPTPYAESDAQSWIERHEEHWGSGFTASLAIVDASAVRSWAIST